jgi:hypothetical protein
VRAEIDEVVGVRGLVATEHLERLVLVDAVIPQREGVFPMVPAGRAMHEMLFA